jgi:hypothetical protein
MLVIRFPWKRREKHPKQSSFAEVLPDNKKRIVSQQGTGQTQGVRPHVVNILLLKQMTQRRNEATVFVPALESLFNSQHDRNT